MKFILCLRARDTITRDIHGGHYDLIRMQCSNQTIAKIEHFLLFQQNYR